MNDHNFCRALLREARLDAKKANISIPQLSSVYSKIGSNRWYLIQGNKGETAFEGKVCCAYEGKSRAIRAAIAQGGGRRPGRMTDDEKPRTLTAAEAAVYAGYETERRFRLAVGRGAMPQPMDPDTRPQLWSVAHIDAHLNPTAESVQDAEVKALDQALGLAS